MRPIVSSAETNALDRKTPLHGPERTEEERYSDLLRHLASPSVADPAELVEAVREIQHLHSMGHITDWQMTQAQDAYAATIEREPNLGPPKSPESRADGR
jgi:hypothetical protein